MVLAEDEAQERALGPPRLIEIVSKYYRGILQARIQEIRQGPAEAKDAPLSNLENSIRGGMAFLSLISRTSSITNAQSLQARPSKELSSNKVSIVSQAPIGVSGCSDDEGEGKGGHGDLEGAAGDVAGPLPILIANRPLPSNHTRTHSSARGPSGDGGEFNTVQEERNSCSLFFSASQVPLGPEEASWALHPLGGTGVRFSNLSQASPLKRGSITVEGLLNSPSLDVRNNPIYRFAFQHQNRLGFHSDTIKSHPHITGKVSPRKSSALRGEALQLQHRGATPATTRPLCITLLQQRWLLLLLQLARRIQMNSRRCKQLPRWLHHQSQRQLLLLLRGSRG